MDDRKLLKLLQTDKNAGMSRLIKQCSGFVFAIVRQKLQNVCDSSEIEDCVCEVFERFSQNFDTYKPEASLKTYLGVLARNAAANLLRNRVSAGSIDDEDFFVDVPDGTDLEDEAARRELLGRIYGEIRAMGHPDSDILFYKFYLGQSSKQIADALHVTVSNVDTRTHRAVAKLKTKFGGEDL